MKLTLPLVKLEDLLWLNCCLNFAWLLTPHHHHHRRHSIVHQMCKFWFRIVNPAPSYMHSYLPFFLLILMVLEIYYQWKMQLACKENNPWRILSMIKMIRDPSLTTHTCTHTHIQRHIYHHIHIYVFVEIGTPHILIWYIYVTECTRSRAYVCMLFVY